MVLIILVKMIAFLLSKYYLDGLILKWRAHEPCFDNFILEQKSFLKIMRREGRRMIDFFPKLVWESRG